jgi:signal transduction histidine kinase
MNHFYKSCFLLFLACLPLGLVAQISDSLYKALPDSIKPTSKTFLSLIEKQRIVRAYSDLALDDHANEMQVLANSLQKAADITADNSLKAKAMYALADFNSYFSKELVAIDYYKKAIELIEGNEQYNHLLATIYSDLAISFSNTEQTPDSALKYLHSSEMTAGVEKDSALMAKNYCTYSSIYHLLRLSEKSIYYQYMALQYIPENTRHVMLAQLAVIYTGYYEQTKNAVYADSAKKLLYQVIGLSKNEAPKYYEQYYYNLGRLAYKMGEYATCINMMDSASLPEYNITASYFPNNFYAVTFYKALSLIRLGHYAQGKKMLENLPIKRWEYLKQMNEALYLHAKEAHNWEAALEYFILYKQAADSVDLEGQKGKIFETEQKYSVSQKEAAIAKLEAINLLKEREKINILIAAVVLLLLSAVSVYLYNKKQQANRKKEREMLTDNLHRMELDMKLSQAQEKAEHGLDIANQRKAISQNMHDEVSSGLAALKYLVADYRNQNAGNEKLQEVLGELQEETHQLYQQSRTFVHGLYNSAIQAEYNIVDYLQNLSLRFEKGSSLQILTTTDKENIDRYFTPLHHQEMFRIIKEAVTNTMKHSGASEMHISINFRDGLFHFTITDNGKGINADNRNGLGMGGFSDRIANLNGDISVQSNHKGTEISGRFRATA